MVNILTVTYNIRLSFDDHVIFMIRLPRTSIHLCFDIGKFCEIAIDQAIYTNRVQLAKSMFDFAIIIKISIVELKYDSSFIFLIFSPFFGVKVPNFFINKMKFYSSKRNSNDICINKRAFLRMSRHNVLNCIHSLI